MHGNDWYACSGPSQPVVVFCAEREQPSRPSYTAEGSGLEAPWLRLHIEKHITIQQIMYYDVSSGIFSTFSFTCNGL